MSILQLLQFCYFFLSFTIIFDISGTHFPPQCPTINKESHIYVCHVAHNVNKLPTKIDINGVIKNAVDDNYILDIIAPLFVSQYE